MSKLNLRSELAIKYGGTYIRLQEHSNSTKRIFYIEATSYDEDENVPRLSSDKQLRVSGFFIIDGEQQSRETIDLAKYIIDLSIPEEGYKNCDKGAVYFNLEAHKQYKRSLSPSNMVLSTDGNKHVSLSSGGAFKSNYATVPTAVDKILGNHINSIAIAQHYALGRYMELTAVFIFYKTKVIGVVNKKDESGEYFVKLPQSKGYLKEDIEQFISCEVTE